MKKIVVIIFLLPVLLIGLVTNNYKISIGDDIYYSSFSTTKTDSLILYKYDHEAEQQINYYNLDGSTWKFTHTDSTKNIDFSAIKNGNEIILYGKNGKIFIDKTVEIDDSPWKQSMSYSLSEFALSNKDHLEFWIIRLDKFEAIKMKAEKEELEEITIVNEQYLAVKVKISATGFRSAFWHGYYWFRNSDGLFLRYKGLNGLPGSTETIVEFIEKE